MHFIALQQRNERKKRARSNWRHALLRSPCQELANLSKQIKLTNLLRCLLPGFINVINVVKQQTWHLQPVEGC